MKILEKIMQMEMLRSCLDAKTLAKRAGLSHKTVYKALHGENVRPIVVARIAYVLRIDPNDLIVQEVDK